VRLFQDRFGDGPVAYADVLATGITPGQLRAAVSSGALCKPRRGWYGAPPPAGETYDERRRRHLAAIRSALAVVGPGAMTAHESAAVVQRMATPLSGFPTVVTLVRPGITDFVGPGLIVRGTDVPLHHRREVDGIPCTSLSRTAVDLARGHALPEALIALDSGARLLVAAQTSAEGNALRHAARTPALVGHAVGELDRTVAECVRWPGIAAVRRALPHADPAAESPPESRSRGWLIQAGLTSFLPGYPVDCAGRRYWADLCDPTARVIAEIDGWGTYGLESDSVRERLAAERDRQRRMEDAGWRIVRWTSTDRRGVVIQRVLAALP
jgi:hypothetical protein